MERNEFGFRFLRDTDDVKEQRKYIKAETCYAGSLIFTDINGLGLIADGIRMNGYNLINLIMKGNFIRNQAKNLLKDYNESSGRNEEYIGDMHNLINILTSTTTKNIKTFQKICVIYNELTNHEESFDEVDEESAIHDKVDEILFERFINDNWTPPENEWYNDPTKKLDVPYDAKNIENYFESYISEFNSELDAYLSNRADSRIIDKNLMTDNHSTFKELNVESCLENSYREIKKALIDVEGSQKICSSDLMVENVATLLKEIRHGLNMTLQDVSNITGLTSGYISRVENNSSTLSIESLFKLCVAYNVDLERFLTNARLAPLNSEEEIELSELLSRAKVKLKEQTISATDKKDILKFAILLIESDTKEIKEAVKNILNAVIKLK